MTSGRTARRQRRLEAIDEENRAVELEELNAAERRHVRESIRAKRAFEASVESAAREAAQAAAKRDAAIVEARARGYSWGEISSWVGIPRQNLHRKYATQLENVTTLGAPR